MLRKRPGPALALASLIQAQPNASSLEIVRAEQIEADAGEQLSAEAIDALLDWGQMMNIARAIEAVASDAVPDGL